MEYNVIFSSRKTISLKVSRDLSVTVHAPKKMAQKDIEAFVAKHSQWIEKQMGKISSLHKLPDLSHLEQEQMGNQAAQMISEKVAHFSEIMKLYPTGVKITSAKTRWGSCSGKNSLCFSLYLVLLPSDVVDYIVVHELAHIKEKNHGKGFYALVESYIPNYKELQKKAKEWA